MTLPPSPFQHEVMVVGVGYLYSGLSYHGTVQIPYKHLPSPESAVVSTLNALWAHTLMKNEWELFP